MTSLIIVNATLALLVAIVVVGLLASAIRRSHTGQPLETATRSRHARGSRPAVATQRRQPARPVSSGTF